MYFLHGLSFVKLVPTSNLQIIRKGAHLNFAMGATLLRYATGVQTCVSHMFLVQVWHKCRGADQWRTQNIFMGGFHSVAYGIHLFWCALFVTSQFDVMFMFPNQPFGDVCWHNTHIFDIHSPYLVCHCTEYKLLAFQVRISEENTLNATTQQFITAKISGFALKQGNKTHSSMRQRNLRLQNEAAL